eukprot:257178-Prorocentrum_minimum.AAC.3
MALQIATICEYMKHHMHACSPEGEALCSHDRAVPLRRSCVYLRGQTVAPIFERADHRPYCERRVSCPTVLPWRGDANMAEARLHIASSVSSDMHGNCDEIDGLLADQ